MNAIVRPKDDFYPTPAEATRAFLSVEQFPGGVWEPFAGAGHMSDVFRGAGIDTVATTLHDGSIEKGIQGGRDFRQENTLLRPHIASNPPYGALDGKSDRNAVEKLLRHAFSLQPASVSMFLPMNFWGGQARQKGFHTEFPPIRIWMFSNRFRMVPGDFDDSQTKKKHKFTFYHAWFRWEWPFRNDAPRLGLLNANDFKEGGATV